MGNLSMAYAPGIALIKTGITYDAMDNEEGCDSIEFTYTVTNQSTNGEVLENIEVVDNPLFGPNPIPGPISGDDNNNGTLDLGETWIYTATYIITQSDVDNTQIAGNANVTANLLNEPSVTVNDISDDDEVTGNDATVIDLTLCQPNIALIKTGIGVSGEGDPQSGNAGCDVIVYTFVVTSEGFNPPTLENIQIEDELIPDLDNVITGPDGDTNNNNLLDPGEAWVYLAPYDITPSDISNGEVQNQATVTANIEGEATILQDLSDDDSILENEETVVDLSLCQPNIAMIKTGTTFHGVENGSVCVTILYDFLVASKGLVPEVLENIVITDPLIPDLENIILGPFDDSNNNGLLDPNEEWRYTALYTITSDDLNYGEVINQASVTANIEGSSIQLQDLSDDDSYLEDDETVVDISLCQEPEIGLVKTGVLIDIDNDGCNDHIQYTFTAFNLGNVDLVDISIQDTLLADNVGPVSGDVNEDSVLSINEQWTYTALYDLTQTDIDNGQVQNIAEIFAATYNGTDISDFSHFAQPDLDDFTITVLNGNECDDHTGPIGLIKQGVLLDMDGDGCDDHIQYNFSLTNIGPIPVGQIIVNDPLFGGEITGPQSGDDNNDEVLDQGEVWIYIRYYDILQSDIDVGQVLNQANVSGTLLNLQMQDDSDDDSYSEDEITQTNVVGTCDNHNGPIGLIKTGTLMDGNGDGCSDQIQYNFTVRNQSPVDIYQVVVEDNDLAFGTIAGPISGDLGDDGILGPNEEWIYTQTYNLTQADVDATEIINQAEVRANLILNNDPYSDLSDHTSFSENNPTITSTVGACGQIAEIGLIKVGELVDLNGDGCNETIRYTFTVSNVGDFYLDTVTVEDGLLGASLTVPDSGDTADDGILSIGEEWTYTFIYGISETDIEAGQVENQASVSAEEVGTSQMVSDLSHPNSYAEDGLTLTTITNPCDGDGNGNNPIGSNFEIFNGITPNSDNFNDHFHIQGIENYPNNNVKIFNRWGVLVYEADGYGLGNNLFRGVSEGRSTVATDRELPSGTYFYILTFGAENPGKSSYTGYLYINRN
ncbi:gliding motility-associated C-terminal domain-containing protein [Flagellimonas meishanensis]|uniref:gliding motility-associated C-terminal domain-containing protein n=1 Tax=Flagellimonas meishanensis TaxID=2873264 RepID=UPI001CA606F1|nr:gliding motility-associated C-terminal domain-containing protein [[Muricauda] meishanensis]